MNQTTPSDPEIEVVERTTQQHIRYFEETDSRCRGMQLPDGLMLRFNLAGTLYFYLRTGVGDGKITSRVFASDSPYEREKAFIGAVATPMFAELADYEHLRKVEKLVRSWVEFVTSSCQTLALETLEAKDVRPLAEAEILHDRLVATGRGAVGSTIHTVVN